MGERSSASGQTMELSTRMISSKTFCEQHGIRRHFTIRMTSQQNGVAERMNRLIAESA